MIKNVKNYRVPRTHNGGTMTKSQFFGSIISSLRQLSRWWVPIKQAKLEAKRKCKIKGRQIWEYQCANCKKWFKEKDINVDHKIETGGIKDYGDIESFVKNLFCEKEGFQILCKNICHKNKTNEYMKLKRKNDRK